jgi:hypothetical protein
MDFKVLKGRAGALLTSCFGPSLFAAFKHSPNKGRNDLPPKEYERLDQETSIEK